MLAFKLNPKYKKIIKFGLIIGLVYILLIPSLVVYVGRKHVYKSIENIPEIPVTIVFGAGVLANREPSDVLEDRLNLAAELYSLGKTQKILVSGDNRQENYNEPEAMFQYLVQKKGIPEDDIVRDYAGRRTYDTCKRANEIWDVKEAILITQGYHLPRSMFTCQTLGVNSFALSSTKREYLGELRYKFRELIAIHKSIVDLYVLHPDYIGGEKEDDFKKKPKIKDVELVEEEAEDNLENQDLSEVENLKE